MSQLLIPDCSEYQGFPRWDVQAANGYPAGIARVCYSDTHVDNSWRRNFPAMRQYLRWRGFYAYVLPTVDVASQARFFAAQVGRLQPGEVAFADIEEDRDGRDLTEFGAEWLSIVHDMIGGEEGEYSGDSFAQAHLDGFKGLRLAWGASYGAPLHVAAFLHQFTDRQRFPGIGGLADASVFEGTIDDLLAFTGGATQLTPEEAMGKFGITHVAFDPKALENLTSDHEGRLPFWGTKADGSLFAFNNARPIAGLNARDIKRDDVVGIAALPDGSGVVLACDDGAQDAQDSDGWAASTYVLR